MDLKLEGQQISAGRKVGGEVFGRKVEERCNDVLWNMAAGFLVARFWPFERVERADRKE